MKPHERRAAQAYPYYKLARWDEVNQAWKELYMAYPSHNKARARATRFGPGRYRISTVHMDGRREDGEAFAIKPFHAI